MQRYKTLLEDELITTVFTSFNLISNNGHSTDLIWFDLIRSSKMFITQHLVHKKSYMTRWRVINCYAIEF